jgi:alpha-tubulin suppressor-like RCC1 family protein
MAPTGYKFPILDSAGNPTSTTVEFADMFVPKSMWARAGLWMMGYNEYGELGDGTVSYRNSPVQIGSVSDWQYLTCANSTSGGGHTAGISMIGTLWTWGYNHNGQLGNSNVTAYSSPIQVGSLPNWKQVAAGGSGFTVAVKTDGTLWTWGTNSSGQLGNSNSTKYSSPVQVGSLTNWKQVACSDTAVAAIKTDGTLWAWGYGSRGQLGNGTRTYYSSPVQVGSLTNWKQVSCGAECCAAIKTDGTLWTWGYNNDGQLGNGTIAWYSSPIQVGSLTTWTQVSSGSYNTSAVKNDGTLWTWGANQYGQLGVGVVANGYSSPIQVGALTNWKQVACGALFMAAIKTDGTQWAWGDATNGALGNGILGGGIYYSPVQIGALTTWASVSCGTNWRGALAIAKY